MPSARNFFTDAQKQEIVKAIQQAESVTSGEIKVHVEESCGADALQRAAVVFQKLHLKNTALKNGVLIYIAVKDRKFAILADEGIHKKAPENFWEEIKEGMQNEFSKGRFFEGLLQGIQQSGEQLHHHFPISIGDRNELTDEISFEE